MKKRADEFAIAGRYADYREMIEAEDLDLISVCTQAPMHAPVAISEAAHAVSDRVYNARCRRSR